MICWQNFKPIIQHSLAALFLWMTAGSASAGESPSVLSLNLCYDRLLMKLAPLPQSVVLTHYHTGQGYPTHQAQLEDILQRAPDVVLANAFNDPLLIRALRQHDIEVAILPEANSVTEVKAFWQAFGEATGLSAGAEQKQQALDSLLQPVAGFKNKKILAIQANHYSFGSGTLLHEVLTSLGAENLAARQGPGLVTVLPEQILAWQPDIIILTTDSARPAHFAMAHRNILHSSLQPLLEERALYIDQQLSGCMGQQLGDYIKVLQEAVKQKVTP